MGAPRLYSKEDRAKAKALREVGWSFGEIADKLGPSRCTVQEWARVDNWPTPRLRKSPARPAAVRRPGGAPSEAEADRLERGEPTLLVVEPPGVSAAPQALAWLANMVSTTKGRWEVSIRADRPRAAREWAESMIAINQKLEQAIARSPADPAAPIQPPLDEAADDRVEEPIAEAPPWAETAHPEQLPPPEPWRTWLFLGGRGAGKTRAGAEWLDALAQGGPVRLALIGQSFHDVREVMVEGPAGLLQLPRPNRPVWQASRRRLVWAETGASAQALSAEDLPSLRGPQFHAAWADEFCHWRDPGAALDRLRMGLRLGDDPKLLITTTPRPLPALRRLLAEPGVQAVRASTERNAANLPPEFIRELRSVYAGTRWERQELDGEILELEGALWTAAMLAAARAGAGGCEPMERVVVAVDPPATAAGDACGIIVAGRRGERAWVLDDRTARGLSPQGWAERVAAAARQWRAERIVAESNQGGEMVRAVLQAAGCPCPVRLAHARAGKRVRAEPVAALYEQGRVTHCLPDPGPLELELAALGAEEGPRGASPDRADALVWALGELMLGARPEPRMRAL